MGLRLILYRQPCGRQPRLKLGQLVQATGSCSQEASWINEGKVRGSISQWGGRGWRRILRWNGLRWWTERRGGK